MAGLGTSYIHQYSIGVMIPPLEGDLGWSRSQITSGMFIISLVVFPLAPLLGMIVDRFGPRRVALTGIVTYCGALAALSLAHQALWTWWLLWAVLAFGHLFLNATVWVAAISSLFGASRGLALAAALSGSGLMSFFVPLTTYYFIDMLGWRLTYVVWGALSASIAVPALYFFFSSEIDRLRSSGLRPIGGRKEKLEAKALLPGPSTKEGFLSAPFFKLSAVTFMITLTNIAILVNIVPILSSIGIKTAVAAATAGIIGIFQIVGRLVGGIALDRLNPRVIASISMLLPTIVGLLLISSGGNLWMVTLAVAFFGLSMGAELDVVAFLGSRYFGQRSFGTIFGGIFAVMALGTGLGPVLASFVYDQTASYMIVLWAGIPLSIASAILIATIGPFPDFGEAPCGG